MNENIYKDKIKFTAEYNDKKMVFLDTEVTVQEAVINNKEDYILFLRCTRKILTHINTSTHHHATLPILLRTYQHQ